MPSRRDFLKTLGTSSLTLISSSLFYKLAAQAEIPKNDLKIPVIKPSSEDKLILSKGLNYDILIQWDDPISKTETFGTSNDFIALLDIPGKTNEHFMWVNHEAPMPYLTHGQLNFKEITKEQVHQEQKSIGGSLLHLKKTSSKWEIVKDSKINKRFDAQTEIPFTGGMEVANSNKAIGTLANCAGGVTPWNTFLSCEENYPDYYDKLLQRYGWTKYYEYPNEHYGWVVEIDPVTQKAKKHTSLGRFEHEGATVSLTTDGRAVVYMGDDAANEHLYKFIATKKDSLEEGTLYVANLELGKWEELSLKNPKLKNKFKEQIDILVNTREAAKLVGATELDRPEDIEILNDKTILLACTNNAAKLNVHGYILALEEKDRKHESLEFKSYKWLECGDKAGISCPDNFAIDKNGNLWVTSDMSEKLIGSLGVYNKRRNNGLFFIPTTGANKGVVYQVGSAPMDAEFTGPCFSPDYKTLFISIQHPGSRSHTLNYTSHWPSGDGKPKASVITIQGPLLDKLQG